jgi:hypothetical protein
MYLVGAVCTSVISFNSARFYSCMVSNAYSVIAIRRSSLFHSLMCCSLRWSAYRQIVTGRDQFTVLYMFQDEQLVVAVTHMTHTEVETGAVGGGTHHQGHQKLRFINTFPPWYQLTLKASVSTSVAISIGTFCRLS